MKNISASIKDNVLNCNYQIFIDNAQNISSLLKKNLIKLNVNFEDYNSSKGVCDNLPEEVYQYQNFFLLKDGENYLLLDGFRRLLWNTPPDIDILIRIYDKKELSDKNILKILVHLNHTKFFGGIGNYFDRGFALGLKIIFDLDILKYKSVFDAYLHKDNVEKSWSKNEKQYQDKNEEVLNRIVSDNFIDDMFFVQNIMDKNIMLNQNFGALLWKFRNENPEAVFDSKKFIEICENNKFVQQNYESLKKIGDNNSMNSEKVVNKMLELYTGVFNEMIGKKVEKSYLEIKEEVKNILANVKKNKKLFKITNSKSYKYQDELIELVKNNGFKSPKFSVVVHPYDDSSSYSNKDKKDTLEPGYYEDFFIKSITFSRKSLGGIEYRFEIVNFSETVIVERNLVSQGGWSWRPNYDKVRLNDDSSFFSERQSRSQNADVFFNLEEFWEDKKVEFIDKTKKD